MQVTITVKPPTESPSLYPVLSTYPGPASIRTCKNPQFSVYLLQHVSIVGPGFYQVQVTLDLYTMDPVCIQPTLPLPALSRISPRLRARVSVSIVYRIATGGYSWIWPLSPPFTTIFPAPFPPCARVEPSCHAMMWHSAFKWRRLG